MSIKLTEAAQKTVDGYAAQGINLKIVPAPNAKFACQDITDNNDRVPFATGYGETPAEAFWTMDKTIRDSRRDLSNPAPAK